MSGFRTRWSNNRRRKPGCHLHYSALVVRRTSSLIYLSHACTRISGPNKFAQRLRDRSMLRTWVYARRPYAIHSVTYSENLERVAGRRDRVLKARRINYHLQATRRILPTEDLFKESYD